MSAGVMTTVARPIASGVSCSGTATRLQSSSSSTSAIVPEPFSAATSGGVMWYAVSSILRASLSHSPAGRGLRLVEGSVTDPSAVDAALRVAQIRSVFHLAAQASAQPTAAPINYTQDTNYTGPRIVLDACLRQGVKRVVMASSMRIYGAPLPEVISESAPLRPTDLVHLSHLYCEVLLQAYRPLGLSGAAARIAIVHGVSPVMKTDDRFLAVPQRFCLLAARGEPLFGTGTYEAIFSRILRADADLDGLHFALYPLIAAALLRQPGQRPTASWLAGRIASLAGAGAAAAARTAEPARMEPASASDVFTWASLRVACLDPRSRRQRRRHRSVTALQQDRREGDAA